MSRRKLSRRHFLGAAAGAGALAGLPWLEWSSGRAGAQGAQPPKRLVIVTGAHSPQTIYGDGAIPEWLPAGGAGPLGALPPLLAPLAEFRDRMTVVAGVDNLVGNAIEAVGCHSKASRTLLSCRPHVEALDDAGALRPDAPVMNIFSELDGPSIEHAVSAGLGREPLVLRVGVESLEERRSFRLDGTIDHGEPNPAVAFDRLFGTPAPDPTPRELLRARRQRILQSVHDDARALSGRVSATDRERLARHADLVRDYSATLDRFEPTCVDPSLDASRLPANVEDPNGRHDDVILSAHNDLIATSLACNVTQVASCHVLNVHLSKFPFLNGGADLISERWHTYVHCELGTPELRLRMMQWYSEMLADLLRKLDAVPEADGTLLDSTLVVWTSSLATCLHGLDNLPVFLFGGRHVALPRGFVDLRADRASLADLWVTLAHHMGVPMDSFGLARGNDPIEGRPWNRGPIDQLFG